MKKQDLLNYFDDALLDRLFGFCYARTGGAHEAEELCSDIIFALVNAAGRGGEIDSVYPFIWRVARNVYADFSEKRRKRAENLYDGDPEEILLFAAEEDDSDGSDELLTSVYRRIAFLTRAYREVMIMFYIDGLSTAEIAKSQGTSETAVRQRLFSARKKIKNEVYEMTETYNRPVALDKPDFVIWGSGNPMAGDPRNVCVRTLSKHIVWLCREKPMSASEIAVELNVPTMYVEEELEILRKGENGGYGLLRRLESGKYAINFILLDRETIEAANAVYTERLPEIRGIILKFVEEHRDEYLAFPYLNRKVDMNLILWQQVTNIADAFSWSVRCALEREYFSGVRRTERAFSVYGYVGGGRFGGGWDGAEARNICGFSRVHADNIYMSQVRKHFGCAHNLSNDPKLQLALRAIDGLDAALLSEDEKEHAAKAIECGYLYREGSRLFTKILVSGFSEKSRLFDISNRLRKGYFDAEAELAAGKIAELIRRAVPDYLLGEWEFANELAGLPILDAVVGSLIEKGVMTPPENGLGAEGCWLSVEK